MKEVIRVLQELPEQIAIADIHVSFLRNSFHAARSIASLMAKE